VSWVFPVTEILAIEDHKLNNTFLHVTSGSQSLLRPTGDQTGSDTNWKTKEGDQRGGEWEQIKILMQELTYVPSSNPKVITLQESDEHTNQQHRKDPLKVMNVVEKECDQLDTRLARYDQNSEQTLLLKLTDGHVRPWTGYVRPTQKHPFELWFMSYGAPKWMKLGHNGHLNTSNKFLMRFFPNPNISLPILNELKEPWFWEKREKSTKSKGLETWIHFKIGGRWWDSM
jgi:hypothetical protein